MVKPSVGGLMLVLAGGLLQGAFMAPVRFVRKWAWENYWLVFATTAYLVIPWMIAAFTVPRLLEVYTTTSTAALIEVVAFGTAWGVGALAFGLGVDKLGMSLGFAIIIGTGTIVGTVIPLVTAPPSNMTRDSLLLILGCLVITVSGVAVCSSSGRWKEAGATRSGQYSRGVLICIASGTLSACGNLGLAFGSAITERAQSLGVPSSVASNALWALLTLPLFLFNSGFSLVQLLKNHTLTHYATAWKSNLLFAASMGVLWMAGLSFYGSGAERLGSGGTSVGFAIFMSSTVLTAAGLGILMGEWKNAPGRAMRQMGAGVALLLIAICLLAAMNQHLLS